MTNAQAAAKIRRAQKTAARLADTISDLRHDLPEAQNSEQELALGALLAAFEATQKASGRLSDAAKYIADNRTEAQFAEDQKTAREEEARENTRRQWGCTT